MLKPTLSTPPPVELGVYCRLSAKKTALSETNQIKQHEFSQNQSLGTIRLSKLYTLKSLMFLSVVYLSLI